MGNLDESFEYKGFFWLPEIPDVEIPGVLFYTPDDGVQLELQGVLHAPSDNLFRPPTFEDAPLILGVTSKGKEVSLLGCTQIKGSVGSGWRNIATQESGYRIKRAFIDVHFPSTEAVEFKEFAVDYTHLDEWFDQNPFQINHPSVSEMALSYKAPESLSVKVGDYTISFQVAGPATEQSSVSKYIVYQDVRVKFVSDVGDKNIDDLFLITRRMQDLITLGVGEPVFPTGIVAVGCANKLILDNGKEINSPVQVFYTRPWRPKSSRTIYPQQMAFTLKAIRKRLDFYLTNWFLKAENLKPVLDIYFSLLYREDVYPDFRLLSLVQALDTYHRWRFGGKYQSDEVYLTGLYTKFLKCFTKDLDEDFRQNLEEGNLRYANEYSLRKRFIELTQHFDRNIPFQFLTIPKERNIFIERVCNTRNYLTYCNPVLTSKVAKTSKELYDLGEKLQALLEVLLLEEIGFEQAQIGEMIRRHRYYFEMIQN
ncbi:MAG: hypothetical protein P8Z00_02595 [Anaerolineales bacterium]